MVAQYSHICLHIPNTFIHLCECHHLVMTILELSSFLKYPTFSSLLTLNCDISPYFINQMDIIIIKNSQTSRINFTNLPASVLYGMTFFQVWRKCPCSYLRPSLPVRLLVPISLVFSWEKKIPLPQFLFPFLHPLLPSRSYTLFDIAYNILLSKCLSWPLFPLQ